MKTTEAPTIVYAPKRLDPFTSPHLAKDLETKIQAGKAIVLDLSKTLSIDPESADIILRGLMLSKQFHTRFGLRGVNHQVRLVLEMAGVLQYFRRA